MTDLTKTDRRLLLAVARSAIEAKLKGAGGDVPSTDSEALMRDAGCFVTLHKKGRLRGCIGTLEPEKPLIHAVQGNALNAAFEDPRFPPVTEDELADIDLEISILTPPEELEFADAEDLRKKLKPGVHGVILSKGWHRATFLPQVWDQLPDVDTFLSHLCQKAGMDRHCWKDSGVEIKIYTVRHFSESQIESID